MKLLIYKLVLPDLRDVAGYPPGTPRVQPSFCFAAELLSPFGAMFARAWFFAAALSSTREIYLLVYILKNIINILRRKSRINAFVYHSPKNEFDLFLLK